MGEKIISALLPLLFLFSGCLVENLSIEQRQACIELAAKAHANVPECGSQQECFAAVQKTFFSFDESVFPADVKEEFYSFKNYLAASWLYFNMASDSTEKIGSICSTKNDSAELPFHVNELNHELHLAFEQSDNAFRKAFSAIMLEESALQKEDIELIEEEPLYSTFIELNNNLNDLKTQEQNSQTFASHYLNHIYFLQDLSQRTGFAASIISETSLLDLIGPKAEKISDEAQKRSGIRIPFLSDSIDSFLAFLNQILKVNQASTALQGFPSFEFFQVYNNLCASSNSSAEKFSEILRKDSENRGILIKRNLEIEAMLSENFLVIDESIQEISPNAYNLADENIFIEMFSMLGKTSEIAEQRFGISNLSDFKNNALSSLDALKIDFSSLKRSDFLGEISLGSKTIGLKELLSESELLKENIDYIANEIVNGLVVLCNERANQIESTVKQSRIPEQIFLAVNDLKSRVNFRIAYFRNSEDNEKIPLCRDLLLEFSMFQDALNDFESFSSSQLTSFEDCMKNLRTILSTENSLNLDFSDFKRRFNEILMVSKEGQNIESVNNYCRLLETDVDSFFQQSGQVKGLLEKFANCKHIFNGLEIIKARLDDSISSETLESFSKKINSLEKYFSSNRLNLSEALPLLPQLESQTDLLKSELETAIGKAISKFAEKNFSSAVFPEEIPALGSSSNALAKIFFENPLGFPVQGIYSIDIPAGLKFNGLIDSSENVLSADGTDGAIKIVLKGIPSGFTFIDFNSIIETSFVEKTELIDADQFQAIFKKTISISKTGIIPKIFASINLLPNSGLQTGNVRIYNGERAIQFSKKENSVSFEIENLRETEAVFIYFSVFEPVFIGTELVESIGLGNNKGLYRFKVLLRNNLHLPLNKVRIRFPLNISGNGILVREFVDSGGKNAKFEALSGNNISIILDSLQPGQNALLFLLVEAENSSKYWLEQLETQKARASSLLFSQSASTKERAEQLIAELGSFGESFFESKELIEKFAQISEEISNLEAKEKNFFDSAQEFNSLKENLGRKITELEQNAALLSSLGFEEESKNEAKKLESLRQNIKEAEALFAANQAEKAVDKILGLDSSLSSKPSVNVKDSLKSKKSLIQKEFKELAALSKKSGFDFAEFEKAFAEQENSFDSALSSNDLLKSKDALGQMGKSLLDFGKSLGKKAMEKAGQLSARAENFIKLAETDLPAEIFKLLLLFESLQESDLIKAKYVSPISLSRAKKISLDADSLNSPLLKESLKEFLALCKDEKFAEAVELFQGFSEKFDSAEQKAIALEKETEVALLRIKEDAIASFNNAARLLNESVSNPESERSLKESEESLKKEQFLRSVLLSKNAVSLLSMPYSNQPFPVYLYPIIVGTMLIFGVRLTRKKREKVTAKKLERVVAVWDE